MKNKSCAIIAEPPQCFPWGYDEEDECCAALKLMLLHRISFLITQGITNYYVPIDDGICLYAAEIIESLHESNNMIQLVCYQSWEEQATKWHPDLRDRYFNTLAVCSKVETAAIEQTPTCDLDAMLDTIDKAGVVLVICAKEVPKDITLATALRYAQRTGTEFQLLTAPNLF